MDSYRTIRRPSRRGQYVFGARRDRQRIAQALAGGRVPSAIAAAERLPLGEIEALLRDRGFVELVQAYRELAALDGAERWARLGLMARELLELGVLSGDLRVAMYVQHELASGRDPGARLVAAVEKVIRMAAERAATEAAAAGAAAGEAAAADPAPAETPAADTFDRLAIDLTQGGGPERPAAFAAARRGEPFAACAATLPDEAAAVARAEREATTVEMQLATTAERLAGRLLGEAERRLTGRYGAAPTAARSFARAAFALPEMAFAASRHLQERRDGFALAARPPPWWCDTDA